MAFVKIGRDDALSLGPASLCADRPTYSMNIRQWASARLSNAASLTPARASCTRAVWMASVT